MSTFVVGDVHGCFETLEHLLSRLGFDAAADRLLMTGDLVNRGPRSLEVLRWARALDDRLVTVMGNHDLHLLARWRGLRKRKSGDTLDPILEAGDGEELLDWLRCRPLYHEDTDLVLIHAGIHPGWDLEETKERAREAEEALRSARLDDILSDYASREASADPGRARIRETLRVLTVLRTCTAEGELCPFSGPPDEAPQGCTPWFELPGRWREGRSIVFGHWAALGLYRGKGVTGLDTGCVWGGALTGLDLETGTIVQVESTEGIARG